MATLNEYRSKFRCLSKQEVIAERRELFETINGNVFFPRIPEDVLGQTYRRQGDVQTYDVLLGEWLCSAADNTLDNPFPELAANKGRKACTAINY